jgi:hypothetical protein
VVRGERPEVGHHVELVVGDGRPDRGLIRQVTGQQLAAFRRRPGLGGPAVEDEHVHPHVQRPPGAGRADDSGTTEEED